MILAFPVIFCTQLMQRKRVGLLRRITTADNVVPRVPQRQSAGSSRLTGDGSVPKPNSGTAMEQKPSPIADVAALEKYGKPGLSQSTTQQQQAPAAARGQRQGGGLSRGYLLLLLLIVSMTICWTPINVYFTWVGFRPDFDVPLFLQISTILFSCQTALDPILFTMALGRVRESLRRVFGCHR